MIPLTLGLSVTLNVAKGADHRHPRRTEGPGFGTSEETRGRDRETPVPVDDKEICVERSKWGGSKVQSLVTL